MTKQIDYSKRKKYYHFVVFTNMLSNDIAGHIYYKKRADLDDIEIKNINIYYNNI